eukprot:s806_g8.t1
MRDLSLDWWKGCCGSVVKNGVLRRGAVTALKSDKCSRTLWLSVSTVSLPPFSEPRALAKCTSWKQQTSDREVKRQTLCAVSMSDDGRTDKGKVLPATGKSVVASPRPERGMEPESDLYEKQREEAEARFYDSPLEAQRIAVARHKFPRKAPVFR